MNQNLYTKCVSCENEFSGNYCNRCGEKIVIEEERTIRYFLGQVFNAFTFADNKAGKTFLYLFTKPGILPRRFIEGQRKVFIAPLPLFLLINLIYFLFNPLDTFNSRFVSQLSGQPYSNFIQQFAQDAMAESGLSNQFFEAQYNSTSQNVSKSILLLFPILFAFPLWGIFYKKSSFLFDHLMLSISFMSFVLLGLLLVLPYTMEAILYMIGSLDGAKSFNWNGSLATWIIASSFCIYLGLSIKNFYQIKIISVIPITVLLFIAFTILMYIYRFILFFLTVWSI